MRKHIVVVVVTGALIAGAAGGAWALTRDDDVVTGPEADRATAAALVATHGGKANSVERDSEDGATWEVEVTKPGGRTVDVRLDEDLEVVAIEDDGEDPNGK